MHVWRKSSEMWRRSSHALRNSLITVWLPSVLGHCSMPVLSIVSIVSSRYILTLCDSSLVILPNRISIGCGSQRTASWSFGRSCLQFSASSSNRWTPEFSAVWIEIVSWVSDTNLSTNWCVADRRKPCCNLQKFLMVKILFYCYNWWKSYLNPWPACRLIPDPLRWRNSCIFRMIVSVLSGWFLRLGEISNSGNGMWRSE